MCIPVVAQISASVVAQISMVVGPVTDACVVSSSVACEALKLVNGRSVYYLLTLLPSHGRYGSSEEVGYASQYVIMLNTRHVLQLEKYCQKSNYFGTFWNLCTSCEAKCGTRFHCCAMSQEKHCRGSPTFLTFNSHLTCCSFKQ